MIAVEWTRRLKRVNPLLVDGVVAVLIGVVEVLPLAAADPPPAALVLALLIPLPLVVRRRAPLVVLVAVLAGEVLYAALGYPYPGLGMAVALAMYSVGAHAERNRSLPALVGTWAVMTALTAFTEWALIDLLVAGVVTLAAWMLGDSHRARRVTIAALEERTAQLEDAQSQLAAQAVAAERARIARELHDVVAHSISAIAVQSGVGAHLIDTKPEQARAALVSISDISRQALDELRRMLGVLREEGPDQLRPAPGLNDLPWLFEQAERAGLRLRLAIDLDGCEVPDALALTVYRIVQEALTNVAKHAGPTDVQLSIGCHGGELLIEVRNARTGRPASVGGAGVGLLGMQERVKLFDGSLEHGDDGGDFRITARLPLPAVMT